MNSLKVPNNQSVEPEIQNTKQNLHKIRSRSPIKRKLKPWKKLLYLQQPYPDNYTNESFLAQLKRNTTVSKYSYWKLVDDFTLVAFHLSNLLLVILTFTGIYLHYWNSVWPTLMSSCCSIIGVIIWDQINSSLADHRSDGYYPIPISSPALSSGPKPKVKSFLIIIFIILLLSPVLKSLTKSTSSDSIWALSLILCLANTIFHDYGVDTTSSQYMPIISTNISLSNAIVLASRLNSTVQVFCFILFAIQINILLPLFDFSIRKHLRSKAYHRCLVLSVSGVVYYLISILIGYNALIVWVLTQGGIAFIMPSYFLSLQKYKNELQGPWDIAKPILNTS